MSDRIEVFKFGGTSIGSAERILEVARIIAAAQKHAQIVVVSSAMTGVTNQLVEGAKAATEGDRKHALELAEALRERHLSALNIISEGAPPIETERSIRALIAELTELLRAVTLIGELTPRTRDRILPTGEKLAVLLIAVALRREGLRAAPLEADTFLETDGNFGEANPLPVLTDRVIASALKSHLQRETVPVITGYCGRAPDGATTTLGRGGSDYSATIIARALKADEVTIWTDVSGVYSADPRVVPGARIIEQLNYREAAEMSYYGAKVLHQRTMIPITDLEIPVRIRNTLAPKDEGTLVNGRFTPGSHPVKAISAILNQSLLSIEGKGMAGLPGVAARVFSALAAGHINITMISQSSSESSICLAIPSEDVDEAESRLKRALRDELSRGIVEEIIVRRRVGLIAAVGLGMAHTPGVAAKVFEAIHAQHINVLAIAQGSSELNISLALGEEEINDAVRALHRVFDLHRIDTGVVSSRGLDLMVFGYGKIGRSLVQLVLKRREHFLKRFGLEVRVIGLSDRSGYLLDPKGLSEEQLSAAADLKSSGQPLAELPESSPDRNLTAMIRAASKFRLSRPVFIDVSDADGTIDNFTFALEHECDLVTANKKPLAGPIQGFEALMHLAASRGRLLKAETTVGAGLPVVDTLEMLMATGDEISRAEGCLSGTLGFVMSKLEGGMLLSEAVAEAAALGYTEPDPVADLSGADVARKALILGRLSGLAPYEGDMQSEGLVDSSLSGLPLEVLLQRLRDEYDTPLATQVESARKRGEVLRYVATVEANHIVVGVRAVPKDSPLGGLKGTDNMIVFKSERYQDRPLVVTGPGAGIDVTAMGVLSDIMRIATERS